MKQGFFVALLAIALGGIGTYAVGQPLLDGNPLAMLGNVKSDLKLNTSQQLQWESEVVVQIAFGAQRRPVGDHPAAGRRQHCPGV